MTYQVNTKKEIWQKVGEKFVSLGIYEYGYVTKECCFVFNKASKEDLKLIKLMIDNEIKKLERKG